MNTKQMIKSGIGLMHAKILNRKKPLIVGFALTNQCNLKCKYCNIASLKEKEMNTSNVKEIITKLYDTGCIRIGFTGGEPLLRKDIKEIINHANSLGIMTTLTTNGWLTEKNISEIENLDLLILSLDGLKRINDSIRGKGTFDKVLQSIKIAKEKKIKIMISCVISNLNKNALEEFLVFIKDNKLPTHFQFVSEIPITRNEVSKLELSKKDKELIISKIIEAKKSNKFIMNTKNGLQIMNKINDTCVAGKIFFRISSDGKISNCWREENNNGIDLKKHDVKDALKKLRKPECKKCEVADGIELGLIYKLNPSSIMNLIKKY